MTVEAYPLCWPHTKPRTKPFCREKSRFETSFARARDEVVRQVEMLCGKYTSQRKSTNLVISTNIPLRKDGIPLANQRRPEDPGVSIYFVYRERQMCFACDRWLAVEDNMQAIAKTIDAIRGISRWGSGDMLEAAFSGFVALPFQPAADNWREVLQVYRGASRNDVELSYKILRSSTHPDRGGSTEAFDRVQRAWERYLKECGHDA